MKSRNTSRMLDAHVQPKGPLQTQRYRCQRDGASWLLVDKTIGLGVAGPCEQAPIETMLAVQAAPLALQNDLARHQTLAALDAAIQAGKGSKT
jgi:hypothetical protein